MLPADPRADLVSPPYDPYCDKRKKKASDYLLLTFGLAFCGGEYFVVLIVVLLVKLAEFLDFLDRVHPLEVIHGDARLGGDKPPPVVEAESLLQVHKEIVRPPEKLLHIVDVGLIKLDRLELLLEELEAEEGEKDPLDEGHDAHDEAHHIAL